MKKYSRTSVSDRWAVLALLCGILLFGTARTAFSQSVADVARQKRAQDQRKSKPDKVYTNDDIPATDSFPSESAPAAKEAQQKPGEESAKEGTAAAGAKEEPGKDGKAAAAPKEAAKPPEDEGKKRADLEKEYRDRFKHLRDVLAFEQKSLDVMQRELSLMQTQYYSDPNEALREQTFRGQINQRTQEIEKQKGAVEKAQKDIADLEEELRKKGLPPGWSR